MELYQEARDIILNSLNQKADYRKLIDNALMDSFVKTEIRKFCNFFFKHYYLYQYLTKKYLNNCTNLLLSEFGLSLCYLQNKKATYSDVKDNLLKVFKKNKETYTEDIENFLKSASKKKIKIADCDVKNNVEYLSMFFNVPQWFVKMIFKQHGKDISKEILMAFKSTESFKNINELVLNQLPRYENRNLFLYNLEDNKFYNDFIKEYDNNNNVLNIGVDKYYNHKTILRDVKLKENNVSLCELTVGQLIAKATYKQDLFIYYAKSCNMKNMLLNESNKIFADTNLIDEYVEASKNAISEIKNYIEDNGKILFIADTIDLKETSKIIDDFLNNNNDFIKEKESFIFPSKDNKSIGYFAILKKVK